MPTKSFQIGYLSTFLYSDLIKLNVGEIIFQKFQPLIIKKHHSYNKRAAPNIYIGKFSQVLQKLFVYILRKEKTQFS